MTSIRLAASVRLLLLCAALPSLTACGDAAPSKNAGTATPGDCPTLACRTTVRRDPDGTCRYRASADGVACDDGNPCTIFQTCTGGSCGGGTMLADGVACDDQDACTVGDSCSAGVCMAGAALKCPAAGPCRGVSTCDRRTGCSDANYPACVQDLPAVALAGCVDNLYAAPFTLGSKTFQLLVDTGSSTTAVASSGCSNCSVSPSYVVGGGQTPFGNASASYTDGSGWSGTIYNDSGYFGSDGATALNAPLAFDFVAISQQQNNFFAGFSCNGVQNRNAYQGIVGLGVQAGASLGTTAYLDGLVAAVGGRYNAFSLQLCNMGGSLWLGGYNPNAVAAPPVFTPLIDAGKTSNHYAVALSDISVGKDSLQLGSADYGITYVDSGTNAFVLPAKIYDNVVARIRSDSGFKAIFGSTLFAGAGSICVAPSPNLTPRQVDEQLPALTFTFPRRNATAATGVTLSATQSYLTPRLSTVNGAERLTYCTAVTRSVTTTVLGAAVLRGLTVVFDRSGQQLGFAPQQGCSAALPRLPGG